MMIRIKLTIALTIYFSSQVATAGERTWIEKWRSLSPLYAPQIISDREVLTGIEGIAVDDVNNDSKSEVIVNANRYLHVLRWDGTGFTEIWRSNERCATKENMQGRDAAVAVGDIDGDGKKEIIVQALMDNDEALPSQVLNIYQWDGLNYSLKKIIKFAEPFFILFSVADVDGDGKDELILTRTHQEPNLFFNGFQSCDHYISVLKWNGMQFIEQWKSDGIFNKYIEFLGVGDVDNNGKKEIIVNAITEFEGEMPIGGPLYIFRKEDSSYRIEEIPQRGYLEFPTVGDVDNDGKQELLFFAPFDTTYPDHILIFEFPELQHATEGKIYLDTIYPHFAVGDVDSDGYNEIIVADAKGYFYMLYTDTVSPEISSTYQVSRKDGSWVEGALWTNTKTPSLRVTVQDVLSGLDVSSAKYLYKTDNSDWMPLLDGFEYTTDELAQFHWKPGLSDAGTVSVSRTKVMQGSCALTLPCNFTGPYNNAVWVHTFPAVDFTSHDKVSFWLYLPVLGTVRAVTVYLRSGAGGYFYATKHLDPGTYPYPQDVSAGWNSVVLKKSAFQITGSPIGWHYIDGIRITFWEKKPEDIALVIDDFQPSLPAPLPATTVTGSMGSKNVETITISSIPFLNESENNYIRVSINDIAGNTASCEFRVKIDATPPEFIAFESQREDGSWVSEDAWNSNLAPSCRVYVQDGASGLQSVKNYGYWGWNMQFPYGRYEYSTDGGDTWITGMGSVQFPFTGDGLGDLWTRIDYSDKLTGINVFPRQQDRNVLAIYAYQGSYAHVAMWDSFDENISAECAIKATADSGVAWAPGIVLYWGTSAWIRVSLDETGKLLAIIRGIASKSIQASINKWYYVRIKLFPGSIRFEYRPEDTADWEVFWEYSSRPWHVSGPPKEIILGKGYELSPTYPNTHLDNDAAVVGRLGYSYIKDFRVYSPEFAVVVSGDLGSKNVETATAHNVPFNQVSGSLNKIRFKVSDLAGNTGTSPVYTVKIMKDALPPRTTLILGEPKYEAKVDTIDKEFVTSHTTFTLTAVDDLINVGDGLGVGVATAYYRTEVTSWVATNVVPHSFTLSELFGISDVLRGCVGYWSFDEGEGDVVYDASGNGNNGRIYNATWTDGIRGKALFFRNSYIRIPESATIDFSGKSFTLTAWVYRESTDNVHHVFGQGIAAASQGLHAGYQAGWYGNKLSFRFWFNDLDTAASYPDVGEWHHVAFTYDAETNKRRIYRDGVIVAEDTASEDFWGSGDFYIGISPVGGAFHGIIDEVVIFNRALTEEVVLLYRGDHVKRLLPMADYIISYYSADKAGNTEGVSSKKVSLDEAAPVTGIPIVDEEYSYIVDPPVFDNFISSNVGIGTPAPPGTNNINIGVGTEAPIYYSVYVTTDMINNGLPTVYVRNSNPGVLVPRGTPWKKVFIWVRPECKFNIPVEDKSSGVRSFTYNITSAIDPSITRTQTETFPSYQTVSTTVFTLGEHSLPDGKYTLSYYGMDNLGNLQNMQKLENVYLDSTSPTTKLDIIGRSRMVDNKICIAEDTMFKLSAEDGIYGSGVKDIRFIVDNGQIQHYKMPFVLGKPPIPKPESIPGAVAVYHFDEGAGDRVYDASGNDNDGICYNTTWVENGRFGRGLHFYNSYVRIPQSADIDFSGKSFTLTAWVYRESTDNVHHVFGQGIAAASQGLHAGYQAGWYGNKLSFRFWFNDLDTAASYPDVNEWHHVAFTYDAETNKRRIYRDGVIVAEDTASEDFLGKGDFYIGRSPFGDYFHGIIDEVAIFNRALSAEEIRSLYIEYTALDLSEGEHVISYYSEDNLKYIEVAKSTSVALDLLGPEIALLSPAGSRIYTPPTAIPIRYALRDRFDASPQVVEAYLELVSSGPERAPVERSNAVRVDVVGRESIDVIRDIPVNYGEWVFVVKAKDWFEHVTSSRSAPFTVIRDTQPPRTALVVHGPQFIVDSPLQQKTYITWETTITVSAVDDLISFGDGVGIGVGETVVSCDTLYRKEFINTSPAAGEAFESAFNLYTLPEGVYTISYHSVDTIGNTEADKAYTVIIDTTPPITTVEVSTPMYKAMDRIFVTERTKFVLTSMDGGVVPSGVKKIEYSVDDGEFREYIEPFDLFGIGEGEHVVHYRAIDNLGNTEKIKSLTVVVDNTPPYTIAEVSAPKYHAPGDGLYVSYRAKFRLISTDDGGAIPSGVKETLYSIDAGLFTVYSNEFGLVNLDDGIHDVKYFSEDNVGNKEKVNTLSVKLDNTAPISKLTIDGPQYSANGKTYISADSKVILAVNDPVRNNVASGVKEFKYTINGTTDYYNLTTEFNVYETSVVFKLCGGVHTVKYYGIDNVDNVEPGNSFTLYVDTVPPITEIYVGEPKAVGFGKVIISPSTEITFTSYDLFIDSVASGVNRTLYRINYATWTTNWVVYVASFTLQESEEAVIEYYSIDNVGNAEIVRCSTFTVTVLGDYASVGSATTTVRLNGNATVVGSIRSNGDIYLSGNSKVTGDAISSCKVVLRGKSSVAGQTVNNASPILSEPVNLTSIEDVVRTQNDNNRISSLLSKDGELKLTGKDKVVIPAGTYYITKLSISGSAEVSVSGKVNIFVADEIEISGDAKVNIDTATSADNLIIFCSNNSKKENKISSNSIVKAIIYSPYSAIKVSGNSYFFGHLFANSITLDGNVVLEQPQYNKPLAMSAPRPPSPVSAAVAMAEGNNSDNDDTAEFKLRDSYVAPNLAIISGNKVYAASRNYSADAQTPATERCCIKLVLMCGIADKVRAKVYTLTGELVWEAELDGRTQWTTVGNNYAYVIQWSPEDNNNSKSLLPSGVYFCLLEAEKAGYPTLRKINKLIIVR